MSQSLCLLKNHTKLTPINWVGIDGSKYDINTFKNWGIGGLGNFYRGKEDLPINLYPYTVEYKEDIKFKCCTMCNCTQTKSPIKK